MPGHRKSSGTGKAKRAQRHHSCESCRIRRSKCDGGNPCTACIRASKKTPGRCLYSASARSTLASISRKRRISRNAFHSSGTDQTKSSDKSSLHNQFSLYQAVDDFINTYPLNARGGPEIDRIHKLCSGLRNPIEDEIIYTKPTTMGVGQSFTTVSSKPSKHGSLSRADERISVRDKLMKWQTYLDVNVEQNINEGKFATAWHFVPTAMRGLETIDLYHRLIISQTRELGYRMRSMCLKLVDWECTLSRLVGGSSHLPSWMQAEFFSTVIDQGKCDEALLTTKIGVYCHIQRLISVDTSQAQGLVQLLERISDLGVPSSTNELLKLATTTTENDSVQKQELGFFANIMLVMLNCRAGLIHRFYEENEHQTRSQNLKNVLRRDTLRPQELRTQVMRNAGKALDRFEALHLLDAADTSHTCFRIYGVIIAVVIIAVNHICEDSGGSETDDEQLSRIRDCFQVLRSHHPTHALLETGIVIMNQYLMSMDLSRMPATMSPRCEKSSSPAREKRSAHQIAPQDEAQKQYVHFGGSLNGGDDGLAANGYQINFRGQALAPACMPAGDALVLPPQETVTTQDVDNISSFCTANEYQLPEQYAQTPTAEYYTSDSLTTSLSSDTPCSPYPTWPACPPLAPCQTPNTMWYGGYPSRDETEGRVQANSVMNAFVGQIPQGHYFNQAFRPDYACPMPAADYDSFGQHSTGFTRQTVTPYVPDLARTFPSTTRFSMEQPTSTEAPGWAIQAYPQVSEGDQATAAGAFCADTRVQ